MLRLRERLSHGMVLSIMLVAALCGLVLLAIGVAAKASEYSFGYFSLDPAALVDAPPFIGVLSHIGVLVLWGSAVTTVFTGALVARSRGWRVVLPVVALGAGLGYLAVDDLFLLHEDVYPSNLGIGQTFFLLAYVALGVLLVWWHRALFLERDAPLLVLAMSVLSVSVLVDLLTESSSEPGSWLVLLEDGSKFYGYGLLASYAVRLAVRLHAQAYPTPDRAVDRTPAVSP